MRVLCVLLAHFPWRCEVRRNPALEGRPGVVTYSSGSRKLVMDWFPELEGLQRDMPLQQALARYGEVELLQADIPCMVFGKVYERHEHKFRSPFLIVKGRLSRREGTCNVVITQVKPFSALEKVPQSKDWR